MNTAAGPQEGRTPATAVSGEDRPDAAAVELDREFHHVLLWMPNWIGDVVLALPAIQSLRKKFPQSRFTAVVKSPSHELLSGHPAIDTVIRIPYTREDGFLSQARFARHLKEYRFDLGVAFPNSIRSAFLLYLTGASIRLGYNTEGRRIFLTHPVAVARNSNSESRVDYYFKILAPLGIGTLDRRFEPLLEEKTRRFIRDQVEALGWGKKDFLVAVHPGASKPQRGWHIDRFSILCQRIIKEHQARIILIGDRNDAPVLQEIRGNCPAGRVHVFPDLNLQEIAALIETCHLFIGNDSGIMHLAAMAGTPLVALFGPGSPLHTGPMIEEEKRMIVTKSYPCSPCGQRFFKECKPSPHNKPFCLEDISVKDVAEAVDAMVRRRQKG